ncbi:MAG: ATP-binding cassette domain-containing protein [Anaerovoracaceae bacterium]
MDGDNYESNIRKQLGVAHMGELEETMLSQISGGEYKLLQIMREMLLSPNLLVLDEPDVFLDFANLNSLCQLINQYKGTLLVVTHNRYLLNHCFNKILHLENGDIQEFDGNYTEYRCAGFREKLKLRLQNMEEQEEIASTERMVEILRKRASDMVNPEIGKSVNAKQSQLDRLLARQIKAPFIEVRKPEIALPDVRVEPEGAEADAERTVLKITDYQMEFDKDLLQNVNFELRAGEKVAIVGANGTGKTTLIRDILKNDKPHASSTR